MSGDRKRLADRLVVDQTDRWSKPLLADEQPFDRRSQMRLAAWGVSAISALTIAALCLNTAGIADQRQVDTRQALDNQAAQIAEVARQSDEATRRLAMAIEQLHADRDRLFVRLTGVENDVSGVRTNLAAHQTKFQTFAERANAAFAAKPVAAPAATQTTVTETKPDPAPKPQQVASLAPPTIAPSAATAKSPKDSVKPDAYLFSLTPLADTSGTVHKPRTSDAAPVSIRRIVPGGTVQGAAARAPESAQPAAKPAAPVTEIHREANMPEIVVSAVPDAAASLPPAPVRKSSYGIDLGGASTLDGARAIWQNAVRANPGLADLQPLVKLRERSNGQGVTLRVVAGPLPNVALATKRCAEISEHGKSCETTAYEGQSLPPRAATTTTSPPRQPAKRRAPQPAAAAPDSAPPVASASTNAATSEPAPEQIAEAAPRPVFGNFFGRR